MTETAERDEAAGTVAQGKGWAAQDFQEALAKVVGRALGPVEGPIRRVALGSVEDLIGFYCLWHLEGGFAGLERIGMKRATIYRKVKLFRESFGEHPDQFEFPGIEIRQLDYLAHANKLDEATTQTLPRVAPSWADVAKALGVTKQAARKKYGAGL